MNTKYINKPSNKTDQETEQQKLYQILPIEYIDAILINKKIRFNNIIQSWEDPYELFLFRDNSKTSNSINNSVNNLEYDYFGQCWSTRKNSDAMWRIYSTDRRSVRISTTIKKLLEVTNRGDQTRYIGWIKYKSQKEIKKFREVTFQNPHWIDDKEKIIDSLFTKRFAFDHEKEVRIIIQQEKPNENHIEFDINPTDFIEEIAFDPRMNYQIFKCKKEIYGKVFPKNKIIRSDLYTSPGR